MIVADAAYNACERNGSLDTYEQFQARIEALRQDPPPCVQGEITWVYLGFELCEKMQLMADERGLLKKAAHLHEAGLRCALVLPVMHQSSAERFAGLIQAAEALDMPDEWIVNDIGTLFYLRQELHTKRPTVLGRMFEKGIREARIDLTANEHIHRNFSLLQPTSWETEAFNTFVKTYQIAGIETDTLPDGLLDLSRAGIEYRVHYPDIYLSSASYCEYQGLSAPDPFTLDAHCGMECVKYEQCIPTGNAHALKKIGNGIFATQHRPLASCVEGMFRLVYSQRGVC